jgi:TPR repeat protein
MWRFLQILAMALAGVLASCSEIAMQLGRSPEEVLAAAEAGDAGAAYLAYEQATTDAERRKWICIAANRDLPEAQAKIARLHWHGFWEPHSPFGHDLHKAYLWSVIAVHRGQPMEEVEMLLGGVIPGVERWRVRDQAYAWKPDPAQCDNMAESGYFNVPGSAKSAPTEEEVLASVMAGEARAAFRAYRRAETDAERRKWLCIAANNGSTEAQTEIGRLHAQPSGDPASPFAYDLRKAYIWSVIAVHRRMPLEDVEQQYGWMVTEGRWRATALAISWRPDPAQCGDMEGSDYFSLPPAAGQETSLR